MMLDDTSTTSVGTTTMPMILCCLCGTKIVSNPANMCLNCLKSQVDITEGISKQVTVFFCRNCSRYQRPPWVALELESREMLAFCLKKIRGLGKEVKLVDASFVWTEPHSRRIKVKLTIQKEVFNAAILQQSFIVEFIIATQQCVDCQKSFTEHTWTACVQVRQKVSHKKTMLMLEQLLLKHNVVVNAMGVKEHGDGLDFYWARKSGANHLLDFLRSVTPIRSKMSKRLISQDDNSNVFNYKYTLYAEIAPVCKDDLVALDAKLSSVLGVSASNSLFIVTRVSGNLTLLDPISLRTCEVSGGTYWHHPFKPLMTGKQMTEYCVLEKEIVGKPAYATDKPSVQSQNQQSKSSIPLNNKLCLARFTVMKVSEMGTVDTTYECLSHLGFVLNVGDHVLGYDIANANIEDDDSQMTANAKRSRWASNNANLEVILVRKAYPKKNRAKKRKFTLKQLVKEDNDVGNSKGARNDMRRNDIDMEEFLQELEEDPELQGKVNLYRRRDLNDQEMNDDESEAGELPEVDMEALLEEMGSMQVTVQGTAAGEQDDDTVSESGEFETGWDVGTSNDRPTEKIGSKRKK